MKKATYFGMVICLYWILGSNSQLSAQQSLKGTILDAKQHLPIAGVKISLPEQIQSVISDDKGNFSIEVPNTVEYLILSHPDFGKQEVEIVDREFLNIQLSGPNHLDSYVNGGFGEHTRETLNQSITHIKGEEIAYMPVVSVEQALQGQGLGPFITSSSGKIGAEIRMLIRGASSLQTNTQPAVIIDGVPITNISQNISGGPIDPLIDLNFNDFASIDIRRDAAATALFGARGANGVILIQTKKGAPGKTRISVDLQSGTNQPTGKREFLSGEEYLGFFQSSALNAAQYDFDNGFQGFEELEDAQSWYLGFLQNTFDRNAGHIDWQQNPNQSDWQELAFRDGNTSLFNQVNISMNGGNAQTRFFASANYNRQDGVLMGNGIRRLAGRMNLDHQVNKKTNLALRLGLSQSNIDQVAKDNDFANPLQLVALSPLSPSKDLSGNFYTQPITTYYNSLLETEHAEKRIRSLRNLSVLTLSSQLSRAISLKLEGGLEIYTLKDDSFSGRATYDGQGVGGVGRSYWNQMINFNSKAYFHIHKQTTDHRLNIQLGTAYQDLKQTRNLTSGSNYPVEDLRAVAFANQIDTGESSETQFRFMSYFATLDYGFREKVFLSLGNRIDGSSRYGSDNRFGSFPGVSLAWLLHKESFVANQPLLSHLKLHAGFGISGNSFFANFLQAGSYGTVSYANQTGLVPHQSINPELSFERTQTSNVGLSFGLFDNRIVGDVAYYLRQHSGLILTVPIPLTTGFSDQHQNVGEMENRGWEFSLHAEILQKEFHWNASINVSLNQNTVTGLYPGQHVIGPDSDLLMNSIVVGQPLGVFVGVEYAGVNPDNGDALFYVNDGNGKSTTRIYDQANPIILGDPNPDGFGNMNHHFSYKSFELNLGIQGVWGNQIHNPAGSYMSCGGCWFDNQTIDQLDQWQAPGHQTDVPQARFFWENGSQPRTSRYLYNGSYIRLRNLKISYDLGGKLTEKLKLNTLKLYVQGINLFTVSAYPGWDPEVNSDAYLNNYQTGIDFYTAPQARTVVGGIHFEF